MLPSTEVRSSLIICASCWAWLSMIALMAPTSSAAILQQGDVFLNSSVAEIGIYQDGQLHVSDPNLLSTNNVRIGIYEQATGTVTLDNTYWNNFGQTEVGISGQGILTIQNGARYFNLGDFRIASAANGQGSVFVRGVGSSLRSDNYDFYVGDQGEGRLEFMEGATGSSQEGILGRNGGDGTVIVEGPNSAWDIRRSLVVGDSGSGQLTLLDGGTVRSGLDGGAQAIVGGNGTSGNVLITGSESVWNHFGNVSIASEGYSTMAISDGGGARFGNTQLALSPGSHAFVSLDGFGTSWTTQQMTLARQGVAEVLVQNGASLHTQALAVIGQQPGSFGRLHLDGLGTRWINESNGPPLILGDAGVGEFLISGGAYHSSGRVELGRSSLGYGEVYLQGAGTRWHVLQELNVGISGIGKVTIQEEARLTVGGSGITIAPGSELAMQQATVHVTTSQLRNAGVVHGSGTIMAQVENIGGQVRVDRDQHLALTGESHNYNDGRFFVVEGELESRDMFFNHHDGIVVGENATFQFWKPMENQGVLSVTGGLNRIFGDVNNAGEMNFSGNSQTTLHDDVDNAGIINVTAGSTATFLGVISGNGVSGAGTIFLEGDVLPGFSPGIMQFGGETHFGEFGTTTLEIGGAAPGLEHDQIQVGSKAHLAGELQLIASNPLTIPGNTLDMTVLISDELNGNFDSVPAVGTHLGKGVLFGGITYDNINSHVKISLTQALPGDFNLDYQVDSLDVAVWQSGYGTSNGASLADGDTDFDGDVDGLDFLNLQQYLGQSISLLNSPLSTVPEPTSSILTMVGLLILSRSRRCTLFP